MVCQPEQFMLLSWEPEALKEVGKAGDKMVFLWDEEGAIQEVQGSQSDSGRSSLKVLDSILTIWEMAGGKEGAGQSHSYSGGLLEGLG
jgi:hypothetical protein